MAGRPLGAAVRQVQCCGTSYTSARKVRTSTKAACLWLPLFVLISLTRCCRAALYNVVYLDDGEKHSSHITWRKGDSSKSGYVVAVCCSGLTAG